MAASSAVVSPRPATIDQFSSTAEKEGWLRDYGLRIDWAELLTLDAELRKYSDDDGVVDWTLPGSRRAATAACLKWHFGIAPWSCGAGRLVPVLPNRLAYLTWIRDELCPRLKRPLRGLDVGAGASCVYPLLGAKCYGWSFVATESDDEAFRLATANAEGVPTIRVVKVESKIPPEIPRGGDFDFSMCNPPFFSDDEDRFGACGGSERPDGQRATASRTETLVDGGDLAFVRSLLLLDDDDDHQRVRGWTTSLLGRKSSYDAILADLKDRETVVWRSSSFTLGRTSRWLVAWTGDPTLVCDAFHFTVTLETRALIDRLRDFLTMKKYVVVKATGDDKDEDDKDEADYDVVAGEDGIVRARSKSKANADLDVTQTASSVNVALAFEDDRRTPSVRAIVASFNKFRDAMPGEIARTNRRWRRKRLKGDSSSSETAAS
eukprot:CAMPEP_0118913562 /NCGR_PEP_ID=MMETSP1166-20130328/14318_1 /TAXON_ID=1104430 /ORGANISM="Chrysoreinhardia sp, Strain CCMP3193" /LENGTH=434 /DNA_ID=CAMNT_0006853125 /DNA_START=1 /DNA_END=1305 /DNA_ORIENTATION=+